MRSLNWKKIHRIREYLRNTARFVEDLAAYRRQGIFLTQQDVMSNTGLNRLNASGK